MKSENSSNQVSSKMGFCQTKESDLIVPLQAPDILKSAVEFPSLLTDIHKCYKFHRILGHGHFGTVREATRISTTSSRLKFAIKSIPKEKIHPKGLSFMRRELEVLRVVDHPNVIKCYEIYEDQRYVHVVMELCSGGDLFDRLISHGQYTEEHTAQMMKKIVSAVSYLHSLNICHRDIKADNFLFETGDDNADIKIIDFGLARKFEIEKMHTVVGTPYYMAPEVLRGNYTKECDVWSLGVLLYLLLSGRPPFFALFEEDIFKKINSGKFNFKGEEWEDSSPQVQDLIRRMLVVDTSARLSLDQVLAHEWFSTAGSTRVSIPKGILDRLKNFRVPKKLKLEAMRVAVKLLSVEQIEELRRVFEEIDTNHSGTISASELGTAMQRAGLSMAQEEIERNSHPGLIKSTDFLGSGQLNYTEFLMATLDLKRVLTDEILFMAFKHFDVEGTGYITANSLDQAFLQAGYDFQEHEIRDMVREFGLKQDCKIDFEEFRTILCKFYAVQTDTASPQVRLRRVSKQTEMLSQY